jgi:hypothetical protein
MKIRNVLRNVMLVGVFAVGATVVAPRAAHASLHACVTRSVNATYSGTTWMSQTVCNSGEIAASAGGFCATAGDMKGASTTSGGTDRLVWLWCNQSGNAYWYAVCCQP